jgi:arylsulfatase A-like enzyme
VLRVPLIVRLPGARDGGRVIDVPVGLVDVMPTALDVLGVGGARLTDGRSLAPLLLGDDGGDLSGRSLLAQGETPQYSGKAIARDGWKYIFTEQSELKPVSPPGREELYHLAADPGERQNLIARQPGSLAELKRSLDAFERYAAGSRLEAGEVVIDPQRREQLKALGYLAE